MPELYFIPENRKQKRVKSTLNFGKRRKAPDYGRAKSVLFLLAQIAGVILLAYILAAGFFIRATIVGESMEPTLSSGDRVFLNRISYLVGSPKRGDVIAFSTTSNPNAGYSFKRVVGVPGDTVQIRDGKLYVNDQLFDEDEEEPIEDAKLAAQKITLSENEYFVLGDNRNNSEDSRYESVGAVKKEEMEGKVWMCFSFMNFGPVQ